MTNKKSHNNKTQNKRTKKRTKGYLNNKKKRRTHRRKYLRNKSKGGTYQISYLRSPKIVAGIMVYGIVTQKYIDSIKSWLIKHNNNVQFFIITTSTEAENFSLLDQINIEKIRLDNIDLINFTKSSINENFTEPLKSYAFISDILRWYGLKELRNMFPQSSAVIIESDTECIVDNWLIDYVNNPDKSLSKLTIIGIDRSCIFVPNTKDGNESIDKIVEFLNRIYQCMKKNNYYSVDTRFVSAILDGNCPKTSDGNWPKNGISPRDYIQGIPLSFIGIGIRQLSGHFNFNIDESPELDVSKFKDDIIPNPSMFPHLKYYHYSEKIWR